MLQVEKIELPDYERTLGGRTVRERGDRIYVIEHKVDQPPPETRREAAETSSATILLLGVGWMVWAWMVWTALRES